MSDLHVPSALVETDWLAEHLQDSQLRIFDCTVQLVPDPPRVYKIESGRGLYEAGHIPGAAFLDLIEDCSDTSSGLPFMNPAPAQLASALAAAGINDDSAVVLYAANVPWATRAWWMLKNLGFDNVAVLNGGIKKWRAESRAVEQEVNSYSTGTLSIVEDRGMFTTKGAVHARLDDPTVAIINALAPAMHNGEAPSNYGRPGCIAGSKNVFFQSLLDDNAYDVFRSDEELIEAFREQGVDDKQDVIMYCGGGISATVNAFALHRLGRKQVQVYDGSMTEWANDPDMPMSCASAE